jgi:phage/plasmid primase-like uncharacterized protein/phage/plasmid-associated DNA primase
MSATNTNTQTHQSMLQFMREKNFVFIPRFDNEIMRFDRNGKHLNGWALGREVEINGKLFKILHFGDWTCGEDENYTWQSPTDNSEEAKALAEAVKQMSEKEAAAKKLAQEKTAEDCKLVFDKAISRGNHDYLNRKKISGLNIAEAGIKIDPKDGALLIPLKDIDDKIWSLQRIYPNGDKRFYPGGRIRGCMFFIGGRAPELNYEGVIYVSEGFATSASVYLSTKSYTAGAFNAGNLRNVCAEIRRKYPKARIIICADSDRWSRGPNKSPINPGYEAAYRAKAELNVEIRLPHFIDFTDRPTDFNDLHNKFGLEELTRQLSQPQEIVSLHEDADYRPSHYSRDGAVTIGGSDKMPHGDLMSHSDIKSLGFGSMLVQGKQGKRLPSHQDVADKLIKFYGDKLIKQDRDLFAYTGTHWRLLRLADTDQIKQQMQFLCGNMATSAQLSSMYELFVQKLPSVPEGISLFESRQWVANFRNGSLFVTPETDPNGETVHKINFKEHDPKDYLVNLLPFEYNPDWSVENSEFQNMLNRVFEGDIDKDDKIRALGQMFGACLIPTYPHLFFLYGPPGTGKSTVMKIAARLIDKDNLCSVQPHEFTGFNMESMAGKLVNMDTDVDIHKPIADTVVKKIEDRVSITIHRKGLKDIKAPLPATHIFGGNEIPKTLEGYCNAHDRRWTFLGFFKAVIKGNYNKNYADYCFEHNPQGVLNFALKGLFDLLVTNKGHFTQPASGAEKMKEWLKKTDFVEQFLEALDAGDVLDNNCRLTRDVNGKIKRAKLYELFRIWGVAEGLDLRYTPAQTFYDVLRKKGFHGYCSNNGRVFVGFSLGPTDRSTM